MNPIKAILFPVGVEGKERNRSVRVKVTLRSTSARERFSTFPKSGQLLISDKRCSSKPALANKERALPPSADCTKGSVVLEVLPVFESVFLVISLSSPFSAPILARAIPAWRPEQARKNPKVKSLQG